MSVLDVNPPGRAPAGQSPRWLEKLPLPAGIIRNQRFVYLNQAFLALLQVSNEEGLGMAFEDAVAPVDRDRLRERHHQRLRGEQVPNSYEFRLVRKSGEIRTVEVFVSQSGDEVLFQLLDVTERARRQESLRKLVKLGAQLQRLRDESSIFSTVKEELTTVGTTVVRLSPVQAGFRVAEVLAPAERVARIEASLERRVEGLVWPSQPEFERAWSEGVCYLDDPVALMIHVYGADFGERLRALAADRGVQRGALVRIDAEGQPRELLLFFANWAMPEDTPALQLFAAQISAALDAARIIDDLSRRNAELAALNRVATAAGIARELAELYQRASEEIIELVKCAAVAVFLLEPDGEHARLAFSLGGSDEMRRAVARVPLAGTNLGKVVAERVSHVFNTADYPPDRQRLLRQVGQEVVVSVPMMVRSRVVGVINVAYTEAREVARAELEAIAAVAVHLAAAVETAQLVDDLRRSYEDLSVAHAQLVEQERLAAIGEMAAAVAHEVRNPLGVVFNALSSLRKRVAAEPESGRLVEMLAEESERINHLVEDLLLFARPGRPELAPGVSLEPLLRDAIEAAAHGAPGQVELELQCAAGLEEVALDARLMRQVFVNAAQNAVQAMPRGGKLEVRAFRASDVASDVIVEVRDQGAGIPADVLPRIFEPFFTTRARGTGLGLALVKRIVEGHKGRVEAESAPGRGTLLRIRWPALPA